MNQYQPLIALTCRPDLSAVYEGRPVNAQNPAYTDAILAAGGIPILIPVEVSGDQLAALFKRIDGLLFAGGGDVHPSFYGEKQVVDKLYDVQRRRDELEIRLMQWAMSQGKPFFAICRGIQVMNVAAGGTLWQDISTQYSTSLRHDYYYTVDGSFARDHLAHDVEIEANSRLGEIVDRPRLTVNSLHHQAAREVPDSLRVVARAGDGLIEAIEKPDHPFALGVQWHPEELVDHQEVSRRMFAALVNTSRNGHR